MALLNAMIHTIVEEGLTDTQYVQANTEGFEDLKAQNAPFSPEAMEEVCGIEATTLRDRGALLRHVEGLDHLLGHGHFPARARHRQRPLPDRA